MPQRLIVDGFKSLGPAIYLVCGNFSLDSVSIQNVVCIVVWRPVNLIAPFVNGLTAASTISFAMSVTPTKTTTPPIRTPHPPISRRCLSLLVKKAYL